MGLRLGALGLKTMFVRIPARPGERGVVASRGHFPATLGDGGPPESALARRHRACRLGPARLERRHRRALDAPARPPRAARRAAAARRLCGGAAVVAAVACRGAWRAGPCAAGPALVLLLTVNGWLLAWRMLMRACFTASAYGWRRRAAVDPAAGRRQRHRHARRRPRGLAPPRRRRDALGQDPAHLSRPSFRDEAVAPFPRARGGRLGRAARGDPRGTARRRAVPRSTASEAKRAADRSDRNSRRSSRCSRRRSSGRQAGRSMRLRRPAAMPLRRRPVTVSGRMCPVSVAAIGSAAAAAPSCAASSREPTPARSIRRIPALDEWPLSRIAADARCRSAASSRRRRRRKRPPLATARPAAAHQLGAAAQPADGVARLALARQRRARSAPARPARA